MIDTIKKLQNAKMKYLKTQSVMGKMMHYMTIQAYTMNEHPTVVITATQILREIDSLNSQR